MKPDLSARLSRLKKGKALSSFSSEPRHETAVEPVQDVPEGWTSLDRDVWRREISTPNPLSSLKESGYLIPPGIAQEKWLFFDTETTGLSGGAGNTAFLIGLGFPRGEDFLVIQYFLRDYPGEPVMLKYLKEDFARAGLFISYNGKTYDSHLLQTRFLMNRISYRFGSQLDLLYPVRQLYRRTLPDCRLGTAETFLLGMPRQGDIPGAEIPDMWFAFLKDGKAEKMETVFKHNYLDIIRMADLLTDLEKTITSPNRSTPYRDLFALGKFLIDRDDPEGITLLEQAMRRGDPRAETYLSVYWKRRGEWDRAVSLWERVLNRRPGYFAGVELAKYLEHRKKSPAEALVIVDRLIRELPIRDPDKKAELQHRRNRLLAKIRKERDD